MQGKLTICMLLLFCLTASCNTKTNDNNTYYSAPINNSAQICAQTTNLTDRETLSKYVVLTRKVFTEALTEFVAEKQISFTVKTLVVDDFVEMNAGKDITAQIRDRLLAEYDENTVNYLLIVGAPDPAKQNSTCTKLDHDWEIPMRYVPYLGEDMKPIWDENFIPTDQYFASVIQNWDDTDYDWIKRFDFEPQYFVGRVPVKTGNDLRAWMQKNVAYQTPKAPRHSIFTNDACTQPGAKFPQDFINNFLALHTHAMNFHRCDGDDGGNVSDFGNADKVDFISLYSHGNSRAIVAGKKGYELIAESANFAKPPIIFAHACDTASPDLEKGSLGTELIAMPNGALAYIGYTRSNTSLIHPFWQNVFLDDEQTLGSAVYASKWKLFQHKLPEPSKINDWFALTLFGDPALTLSSPKQSLGLNTQTIQGDEPITVCADISTNEDSGNLEIAQTVYSHNIEVELSKNSASVPVQLQPIGDANQLPKFNYLALQDCDVSHESCGGATLRLAAVLDYSCNWLEREEDNSKSFQVKINNDYSAAVNFVLKAAKGTFYRDGCKIQNCGWDYRMVKQWQQGSVNKGWAAITFDTELVNDALPTATEATENSIYLSGNVKLEAYDEADQLIGSCFLNQTEYSLAFD